MNATTMNRFVKHAQWTTHEPKQFGKVAVLMGGISAERDGVTKKWALLFYKG